MEDIGYYLERTDEWCDQYGVDDSKTYFMCNFLTCIWVSQMRGEHITFSEMMEMLGVDEWECDEEKFYELDPEFLNLDHPDLLQKALEVFGEDDAF
jgi:hypothetical protein